MESNSDLHAVPSTSADSEDEIFSGNNDDFMYERGATLVEIIEAANAAVSHAIPVKSKGRYDNVYDQFLKWKESKKTLSNSERVVVAYFSELAKSKKASTLWATYSMIKAKLKVQENIDIAMYHTLSAFLKQKWKEYTPKKAKTFTEEEMQRFIDSAPDVAWLDVKATCAFAIAVCCRSHELPFIRMDDIKRYDDMYYVTIPAMYTKTNTDNNFAITGQLLDIVRRYEALRPPHAKSDRFFLNYQKAKCTNQVIGKNKFYAMANRIATFLQLPNPEEYTGHSLKRTSVTFYANTGAPIEAIKRHTNHKSTKVCESYIAESVGYKRIVANTITSALSAASSSSAAGTHIPNTTTSSVSAASSLLAAGADRPSMESSSVSYKPAPSMDRKNSSVHLCVNVAASRNREEQTKNDSIAARNDESGHKEVYMDWTSITVNLVTKKTFVRMKI